MSILIHSPRIAAFGGRFYIREGANCQQMSRDEIRESFYKEGLIRFDETSCPRFDLPRDLTPEGMVALRHARSHPGRPRAADRA